MAAKTKHLAANNKRRTSTKPTITTSLHPGHPPPPRSADRGRVSQFAALARSHSMSTDLSTGGKAGFIFVFLKFFEAVQTTLVTTRNSKPKPNIASARYSVQLWPPTPTHKAHAIRPMRCMFNWKRRLARFWVCLWAGQHRGETQITSSQYYILAEAICNGTVAPGATYPVASDPGVDQPPVVQTTDVGGPGVWPIRGLSLGREWRM